MNTTMLLLGLVGAAGVFIAFWGLASNSAPVDDLQARLERYGEFGTGAARPSDPANQDLRAVYGNVTDALNTVMSRSTRTGKLAEDLAKADLKLKPSEWLLGVLGAGVILGVLAALRFGSIIAFLPGVPIAYILSGFVLRFKQSRRRKAFDKQLGETIVLLSNALKAGYSFAQAVSTVSKTANPPIAEEFSRATREMQLGISVDEALNHMVKRNQSEDFDLMVTAVQIHRIVGGNLAEILDTIAFTIRERVRIKGEISTLTAQARASGWIITVLPLGLAGVLSVISPSYFTPMFHQTLGIIMLAMGGFCIAVGFALIQKIVKIEV